MIIAPLTGQIIGLDESQFVIAEWTDPGAPPGPPRLIAPFHVHYSDDEAWYVLEGRLAFRLGNQEIEAPAGSAVFAPRGTPHTYWNPQPTPARYLLIMTPNIRHLIDAIHRSTQRDLATLQTIFHQHHSALIPEDT
ncbi:MAG: cupin domain-containing protein [Chloroflexi bacterium]|nr:cupin domain-containing protein [Chloroflexota bacterium]